MARPKEKLDDATLKRWVKEAKDGNLTKRFMKGDGGGLWFHLAPPHGASWLFRYTWNGREKFIGLAANGKGYPDLSLKAARAKAAELRQLLAEGVDPLTARRDAQETQRMTFKACAQAYIKTHSKSWRNPAHRAQWPSTLEAYVYGKIGDLPVADVDKHHVVKVLEQETEKEGATGPLWELKNETARRVQQRIKLVLDWAKARNYRSGENPAQWAGNLKHLLTAPSKIRQHHSFLGYKQMGEFMADLRQREAISSLALEFTILTAARTKETIGATWGEIDLAEKVWAVPAARMKATKDHLVPLSDAAVAVLEKVKPLAPQENGQPAPSTYVFPNLDAGKGLSNAAMAMLLQKRMETKNAKGELVTVHGFRASFSTWARETTSFPRDLVEFALSHAVSNEAEEAYQHSDMVERRRDLMTAWASLCAGPAGANVKSLREVRADVA